MISYFKVFSKKKKKALNSINQIVKRIYGKNRVKIMSRTCNRVVNNAADRYVPEARKEEVEERKEAGEQRGYSYESMKEPRACAPES